MTKDNQEKPCFGNSDIGEFPSDFGIIDGLQANIRFFTKTMFLPERQFS